MTARDIRWGRQGGRVVEFTPPPVVNGVPEGCRRVACRNGHAWIVALADTDPCWACGERLL